MENIIDAYIHTCVQQLQTIAVHSKADIEAAAAAIAAALSNDRQYYLFGSGHSALIAREAFWRAGGLAPALPIPDPLGGDVERLSGFAATLLAHYPLETGDVIIVISNSGINHLPVEIALECKARGLVVVGLTSRTHSRAVPSRHPSGKKLMDLADIVIDSHVETGDAAVALPGSDLKVGPTSTVIGAAIIQAITSRAAEMMLEQDVTPPVVISSNTPGGDRHNRKLAQHYQTRLVRYEIPTVDAPEKGTGHQPTDPGTRS